jgi:hypothetical protein
MTVDKFRQQNAAQNAAEREFGMYGDFVVFDEAGKLAQLSLLAASGNDFGGVKA